MNYMASKVDYSSLFNTINNSSSAATQLANFNASRNSEKTAREKAFYDSVSRNADETQRQVQHAKHAKEALGQEDVLGHVMAKYSRPYTGKGAYGSNTPSGTNLDMIG